MKKAIKKIWVLTLALVLCGSGFLQAQITGSEKSAEEKYNDVIAGRADKIVKTLGISDSAKYNTVKEMIANNYKELNAVYASRDTQLNILKRTVKEKAAIDSCKAQIETITDEKVKVIHHGFVSDIESLLKNKQVEQVKNALTYNVLNVTMGAYQDMIPTLTKVQKAQMLEWLIEAREHAMDGESSDKKHWWFGKYKGRINNYLSAQGYDLQAERAAWEKRLKEKSNK